MLTQAPYVIKSRAWIAWLIFLLLGVPFLLIIIENPDNKASQLFLVISFLFFFLLYITTRYINIYIDHEKMIISNLVGKKTVLWKDISISTVYWTVEGIHTASLNWTFETKDQKTVEVKLGYYSRADMIVLANHLIEKSKEATISEKIFQMSEGKFPWYLI